MTRQNLAPARRNRSFPAAQKLLRTLVFRLIRLFYPDIVVLGDEKLPDGGVILVANHPNGLIDPAVIMTGLQWDAAFLAKSTFFGNRFGRFVMDSFGALPIFRHIDEGKRGGPNGDQKERNEETFGRCRALLQAGQALALFPEGRTHSYAQLLPLRSGAARIALGAAAESEWQKPVHVVPVGLWYENKTIFRSSILIVIGDPLPIDDYQREFTADPFTAARELTRQIRSGLDEVVLQAEDAELLRAIPFIARWIAGAGADLSETYSWSRRLLSAYRVMRRRDPARIEQLANDVRYYAQALRRLGLKRPLDGSEEGLNPAFRAYLWLIFTLPVALFGFLTTYLTYRMARPVALAVIGHDRTQISTVKLLGGALFVLLGWLIEAVLIGSWLGTVWGWLFLLIVPFCAYVGLLWGERAEALAELVGRHGRQLLRRGRVRRLARVREHLVQEILAAVKEVEDGQPLS